MKFKVISVRDRVADGFANPGFYVSAGAAIRSFSDEVQRVPEPGRPNPLYDHPADFDLYLLGEYDDETGSFETHAPRQIAIGNDYARVK